MPRRPSVAPVGNFWTPQSRQIFHERVERLNQHNRVPYKSELYRQQSVGDDEAYVLRSGEELHLADHVAFLAQTEDGARNVSAVTIEEDQEGRCLTVRVAANETTSNRTVKGLTEALQVLEQYARKDIDRESCREQLFDKVIAISTVRILGRLKENQISRSSWTGPTVRAPLHSRIRGKLSALTTTRTSKRQEIRELQDSISVLVQYLEDVSKGTPVNLEDLIKKAVRQSSKVSTLGNSLSLESHLRDLGVAPKTCESREVLEIDKISRYLDLCNDLLRCCRRRPCRLLFNNIKVTKCISPQNSRPVGAQSICHTHGEVQLILHYERYPKFPPPRSIGSSKSACLLCDLFIKAHGQYRVSHSHKRLYPQWNIPDVNWMTVAQVRRFQDIVHRMSEELDRLRQTTTTQLMAGLESRVHLLVPPRLAGSVSTPSERTPARSPALTPPQTPSEECESESRETVKDEISPPRSPSSVTLLTQDLDDLPLRKKISTSTAPFTLTIEGLSLVFEFQAVREGILDITPAKDKMVEGRGEAGITTTVVAIDVEDVSAETEVQVLCPEGSQTLRLRLNGARNETLCLLFEWGVNDG